MIPNNDRRRSFFTLDNYPGEVQAGQGPRRARRRGCLFYHRNPGDDTLPEMLIEQQGLGAFKDEIVDDLRNRTFGGLLTGAGFKAAGESEGKYQTAAFKAWNLALRKAGPPPPPAGRHPHRPDRNARGVAAGTAGHGGRLGR